MDPVGSGGPSTGGYPLMVLSCNWESQIFHNIFNVVVEP